MCLDMTRFLTSPVLSRPLSVDPTFNFGKYEVTPFTYRQLLLSELVFLLFSLGFVRDNWEEVLRQQNEKLAMALFGLSDVYNLSDISLDLRVDPDIWFSWGEKDRIDYLSKFSQLTMEQVMAGKAVRVRVFLRHNSTSSSASWNISGVGNRNLKWSSHFSQCRSSDCKTTYPTNRWPSKVSCSHKRLQQKRTVQQLSAPQLCFQALHLCC